jgi:hypothetical protein
LANLTPRIVVFTPAIINSTSGITALAPAIVAPTQRAAHSATKRKQVQQTSPAAYVYTTATGRLFITNKSSKRRFLIDMGSDLCVFPRKLIPQRRSRVNYDLRAANCTAIPTYGWLPLSLNLEFCWDFM